MTTPKPDLSGAIAYTLAAIRHEALGDVIAERERIDAKWGPQLDNTAGVWLGVLAEEVDEFATECIFIGRGIDTAQRTAALRAELVQVAAVALGWIEAIDAGGAS